MGLDGGSITVIFLETVEMHQVVTRAIDKEAEELLEDGSDRQALPVLAHRAEQAIQMGREIDPAQVSDEQTQSGTTGDGVVGDLNVVDGGLR